MTISEAAVEAACRSEFPDWDTDGDEWWRGMTRKRMHKALEAAAPHMRPDPAECAVLPQCLSVAYTDGYCDGMSGDKQNLDKYEPAK